MESQIEMAHSRPARAVGPALSTAQIALAREKEITLLSRTRVRRELETSRNPRYVKLLNQELEVLEEKLRGME